MGCGLLGLYRLLVMGVFAKRECAFEIRFDGKRLADGSLEYWLERCSVSGQGRFEN